MEFAVVNNYMGPVATKAMKGYSDENLHDIGDMKVRKVKWTNLNVFIYFWDYLMSVSFF